MLCEGDAVMGWCVNLCKGSVMMCEDNGIAWEGDRTVCECNEKVCEGVRIMYEGV